MTVHQFSSTSQAHLNTVKEPLIQVANRALQITEVDFGITCGKRELDAQLEHVAAGRSQTMKSLHLIGHAIDISPFALGTYQSGWPFFYPIADAFRAAALELGVTIRWGGAWAVDLNRYQSAQQAQSEYLAFKQRLYESDKMTRVFLDGPHFELCSKAYPPDWSAIDFEGLDA